MERVAFDAALLKTVVGSQSVKSPAVARKIAAVVAETGLVAESDSKRLAKTERASLSEAIDTFYSRLADTLFKSEGDLEEKTEAAYRLGVFYKDCSNARILQSAEEMVTKLLMVVSPAPPEWDPWHLLSAIFNRLVDLSWMQGVKSKMGPLGIKVLHKIACRYEVEGSWVEGLGVACEVISVIGSMSKALQPLCDGALKQLMSPDSTDDSRLMSSRFLALSVSKRKGTQHWSQLMGALSEFLKQLLDALCGPLDEEPFEWNHSSAQIDHSWTLHSPDLNVLSLMTVSKMFAGGVDLLERMLVDPCRHRPVPLALLLQLLSRVLSLSYSDLKRKIGSPKSFEFMACFPGLQQMCWAILHLCMKTCGPTILRHSRTLTQILTHSLNDLEKPPAVKAALYETATEYLRITGEFQSSTMTRCSVLSWMEGVHGVLSSHEGVSKALKRELGFLIEKPARHQEGQKVSPGVKKGKKRKATSAETLAADVELLLTERAEHSHHYSHPTQQAPSVIEGLKLVAVMMESASVLPTSAVHANEQLLAQLCLALSSTRDRVLSSDMLLAAYSAILSSVLQPSGHQSRLRPVAVWMCEKGCTSEHPTVSAFCSQALHQLTPSPSHESHSTAPPSQGMVASAYFPSLHHSTPEGSQNEQAEMERIDIEPTEQGPVQYPVNNPVESLMEPPLNEARATWRMGTFPDPTPTPSKTSAQQTNPSVFPVQASESDDSEGSLPDLDSGESADDD